MRLFLYSFFLLLFFSSGNKVHAQRVQRSDALLIPQLNDSLNEIDIDHHWKFHEGDNLSWAAVDTDDSKWDTINTLFPFSENGSNTFKGMCWLRVYLYVDSSKKNEALCIEISQKGASEIYIDGKLIHTLGKVSGDQNKEVRFNPNYSPLSLPLLAPGLHVMAVRYSNTAYMSTYQKYESKNPGISVSIARYDQSVSSYINTKVATISIALILSIFFFTLGFVHFLFFLFYRKQRTNLYYSIFVFLFSALFLVFTISDNSSDPDLSAILDHYFLFVFVLFFYSMLMLHYSLFQTGSGKYFKFMTLFLAGLLIYMCFKTGDIAIILFFSFVTSTVIPSFFIVIRSIRNKLDGAWIIGSGSLVFLVMLAIILVKLMFFGQSLHISGAFVISLTCIAMISIPVSMSVYLAREFALTSNRLGTKLLEVEQLSARSMEQEKEKQRILEGQKEMLESQVKERTAEISEQKKLIEEKNKDITDSISYAKRIQEAILPEPGLLSSLFPDSFILFKPKDIVSGDFYWFSEINEKKILVGADCTGHGVPGALMSMIGCNILNKLVLEQNIFRPDQILNQLHEEVRMALKQHDKNSETRDGMDIAVICVEGQTLQYAAAQRPLYCVRNGKLEEIKADKFPVGGIQTEEKRVFTNHVLPLQQNDLLYLSSDGFADQFGGEHGKKLMTKHFKELLLKTKDQAMQKQRADLEEAIEKWKGNKEQVDDILVIGIRI